MPVETELTFKAKVDFDGTLEGFAAAVHDLVQQARDAGAPSLTKSMYVSDSPNYNQGAAPRSMTIRCTWVPFEEDTDAR